MSIVLNENGEYVDIEPMRLCRVIGAVKPACIGMISVACASAARGWREEA